MDATVVSAMESYGIEITKNNYNVVCGAVQQFIAANYKQAASELLKITKQPSKYHQMLAHIALKKSECQNNATWGGLR